MLLYHTTTTAALASIRAQGLRVACAHPAAKIKGVWLATSSHRAWAILHVIKKHQVDLAEVVVLEVHIPTSALTRFRAGLYYSPMDIPASRLGIGIPGSAFGAGVSD